MIEAGLYLVATPIGNLDDITLRALNILKNSNLILCENTLNSRKLLNKYEIKIKLDKYTDHDFERKKEKILNLIQANNIISLISDSGSPLISDPGSQLVNFLLKNNVKIISIPGPSALIIGIQLSGFLNKKSFLFLGFLPKKHDQKVNILKKQLHNNLIIYTTKDQIQKDILAITKLSKDYEIVILKELTKLHENRVMLNSDNLGEFDFDSLKGELVLCITATINSQIQQDIDKKEALELIESLGIKKAYQVVKTKYKISRNSFYKLAMELKND
jgi:16S rRNA (cytidine1402-2'-O)-methyltransferase